MKKKPIKILDQDPKKDGAWANRMTGPIIGAGVAGIAMAGFNAPHEIPSTATGEWLAAESRQYEQEQGEQNDKARVAAAIGAGTGGAVQGLATLALARRRKKSEPSEDQGQSGGRDV